MMATLKRGIRKGGQLMSSFPLRRNGPFVFISYSFADAGTAERLRSFLVGRGCQVQMEDDRSLLNERLPDILAKRIGVAEVFIQLRTKTSNASYWVDQELRLAAARRLNSPDFVLIPLVLDRSKLDGEVANWVQIDASSAGLSAKILEAVYQMALPAVRLWPLRNDNPTEFSDRHVAEHLAAPAHGKRVIVDSEGVLLTWMDDIIEHIRSLNSAEVASVLEQELRHKTQLLETCRSVDLVSRKLSAEIAFYTARGWYYHSSPATDVANRFCHLTVGREVMRLWRMTPSGRSRPALLEVFRNKAKAHVFRSKFKNLPDMDALVRSHAASPHGNGEHVDSYFGWALSPHTEFGQSPEFVEVELAAGDGQTARVFAPISAIEANAQEAWATLRLNRPPVETITERVWANFFLPQLAAEAVSRLGARVGEMDATESTALIERFPWRREEYRAMGVP